MGPNIADDETFKAYANDIFVYLCVGQRWNTVLSGQPQGSKSFLFLIKAPLLNTHFISNVCVFPYKKFSKIMCKIFL